jgi:hypothetical protein
MLKAVPRLHPIGGRGRQNDVWGGDPAVWRALVRLFCESHIRRQLSTLSKIYSLQEGLTLSSNGQATWFENAQKACDKILAAISSWQRLKLLAATLWPIVVGLLIARLGAQNVYDATIKMFSSQSFKRGSADLLRGLGVAYFVVAIAYLMIPVSGSFSYKRGLFYPAGRLQAQPKWRQRRLKRRALKLALPSLDDETNIYQLENQLFDLLDSRKRPEARLDLVASVCSLILVIVVAYLISTKQSLRITSSPWLNRTIIIAIVAASLIGIVRAINMARRRRWR